MYIYGKTVKKSKEIINNIWKNGYPWGGDGVGGRKEM